ncbi:DUF5666 domain-containing protein [Cellvibrio sp. UBA7671]|uniref:DUF5666 domain-containing protein n=1 Tax=Cellvibrio sp. UBA7671 TaxID=1946312 RepID=UPI002F359FD7
MNYKLVSPLLISLLLAACGGGGGSASTDNTGTNNSVASGEIAQGMVTGFGSVIVNGVHYDVKDAEIVVDGETLVESDLEVGQIVRITGKVGSDGIHGTATKLEGEAQLVGPITSIDLVAGSLVALDQTILVTADTFFDDDLSLELLAVGKVIKVSGQLNTDGVLVATRIDVKNGLANNKFQLSGEIANLDTAAMTFTLNGTLVDYSKATLSPLPDKTLVNGLKVRVIGSFSGDVFVAVGNVHPSCLGFKHHDDFKNHTGITLSGLVSELVTGTSFTLDDTKVLITANTRFDGGSVSDLIDGIQVKVYGALDAEQNLVAKKIKLNYKAKISHKGLVEAIDLTAQTFTVNGILFEVTSDTSFNDRSRNKVRFFDLEDLATGDTLHIRGYKVPATATAPERNIATRVERHNPHAFGDNDWKLEVEGIVEAVGDSSITVAGQIIQVNTLTHLEGFANLEDFFSTALGATIEVKALTMNGVATALKIELED